MTVISSIKTIVTSKNLWKSKKYLAALDLLMWSLVCWRSIPDAAFTLKRFILHWRRKQWVRMMSIFCLDFGTMGVFFFVRRYLLLLIMAQWKHQFHCTILE